MEQIKKDFYSMNDGNYVYVTLTKLSKINEYKSIIESVENKKGILYLDYGNYFVPKEQKIVIYFLFFL